MLNCYVMCLIFCIICLIVIRYIKLRYEIDMLNYYVKLLCVKYKYFYIMLYMIVMLKIHLIDMLKYKYLNISI